MQLFQFQNDKCCRTCLYELTDTALITDYHYLGHSVGLLPGLEKLADNRQLICGGHGDRVMMESVSIT